MSSIILVAESGSDISPELAEKYNIHVVPMHVGFGDITLNDGTFPVEDIVNYYKNTGKLPTTSGSSPEDFINMFDAIHATNPNAHILYLAYSAITTCSYQSALIAARERDYVTAIDTKQVSVGQGNIVIAVAKMLQEYPNMTVTEVVDKVNDLISRAKMCFLPDNLEFLRAGGRVSNVVALGSRILGIHPCIEILDGKLVATKKYRGKMHRVIEHMMKDYTEAYQLEKNLLWCVYTIGFSDDLKKTAEHVAHELGFQAIQWIQANGVITTHGGPAAFGIAGFSLKTSQ